MGIDEVGRGALAGPVMVAAAVMTVSCNWQLASTQLGKLRDSKQLTPKQREAWFSHFKDHPKIGYAVARVYPRAIERINISQAANLAALRAFEKLMVKCQLSDVSCSVFLDGGLYLGNRSRSNIRAYPLRNSKHPRLSASTIIKGDEKIPAVAVASIIAKVTRDRAMVRLAKKHSNYGFEIHKGYGTKKHMAAIKKHGPSKAHRLTFLEAVSRRSRVTAS